MALDLTFLSSNLGKGCPSTLPQVVDPAPGLGDGTEQGFPGFRLQGRRYCGRRMNDAFDGREGWGSPGQCDGGRRVIRSRSGVFLGEDPDLQSPRADGHHLDALLDEVSVRKGGPIWGLMAAGALEHELFNLGARHPRDTANLVLPLLKDCL